MNTVIYLIARGIIGVIQMLPLRWGARIGRGLGGLAFHLTARYRRVTLENLTLIFGREKSAGEISEIAREHFRRLGENYFSAIKTAAMDAQQILPHIEFTGLENLPRHTAPTIGGNAVVAIGHFGNFELFARLHEVFPGYRTATTYRALKQPGLNRVLQMLREKSPCLFFERRTGGRALREAMSRPGIILGLLSDQSTAGMRGPFLGHDCNTGLAPAILALRYEAELSTAICYRVGLAKWRLDFGKKIPTHENGLPRESEAIMREVNLALEAAVRRDPANWFWVHRRWKN
jgi:Kdo2-lipid IVA lauroyltransferase/acyltransferase